MKRAIEVAINTSRLQIQTQKKLRYEGKNEIISFYIFSVSLEIVMVPYVHSKIISKFLCEPIGRNGFPKSIRYQYVTVLHMNISQAAY